MKLMTLMASVFMLAATPAFAHGEHGQPQYGGIVGEAGLFQAELVASDKQLVLHVTEHGHPLSTKGASGKLTLLSPAGKSEVKLTPAADNQLVAAITARPAKGSKVVASISLPGKSPATVRFVID